MIEMKNSTETLSVFPPMNQQPAQGKSFKQEENGRARTFQPIKDTSAISTATHNKRPYTRRTKSLQLPQQHQQQQHFSLNAKPRPFSPDKNKSHCNNNSSNNNNFSRSVQRTKSSGSQSVQSQQSFKSKNSTASNKRRNNQHEHHHHNASQHQDQLQGHSAASYKNYETYNLSTIELLNVTGCGTTQRERAVVRYNSDDLLAARMRYLDPPPVTAPTQEEQEGNAKVQPTKGGWRAACKATTTRNWWSPHEKCDWTSVTDRIDTIKADMETLFNYKPLEVNDETRWKSKVMKPAENETDESSAHHLEETKVKAPAATTTTSTTAKKGKAVAILNKLSWTNLDRLTLQFLQNLELPVMKTDECSLTEEQLDLIQVCMGLVLKKAQAEPHFAELYARFVVKLSSVNRAFQKTQLHLCREEFERDHMNDDNNSGNQSTSTPRTLRNKKTSLGLMKFLGELCKLKMLREAVAIQCLQRLLVPESEEKMECFVQLMTTVGSQLTNSFSKKSLNDKQAHLAANYQEMWDKAYSMAGKSETVLVAAPSTRIKFLIQDMIELKENGWIARRKEEKAKTIAEIHEEVAQEEEDKSLASFRSDPAPAAARSQSAGVGRSRSQSFNQAGPRTPQELQKKITPVNPTPAELEGFLLVGPGPRQGRSSPRPSRMNRSRADSGSTFFTTSSATLGSVSEVSSAVSSTPSSPSASPAAQQKELVMSKDLELNSNGGWVDRVPSMMSMNGALPVLHLSPNACAEKTRGLLKEYFVSGATDDVVITLTEWIGISAERDDYHASRGAAVVQAGILFVLEEGRDADVNAFVSLVSRCWELNIISRDAIQRGAQEPLVLLPDIELDAPKAGKYLVKMIAAWLKEGCLSSLKDLFAKTIGNDSDSFVVEGDKSSFETREYDHLEQLAIQILAEAGLDPTEDDLLTITNLITGDKKETRDMEQLKESIRSCTLMATLP